ncbi:MAG TPA: CNNM domain-containing protein, partial [Chitinophagaceae bacterium]|nr:CNNM domain-containing protein [Chitinophagaceae bacterium]
MDYLSGPALHHLGFLLLAANPQSAVFLVVLLLLLLVLSFIASGAEVALFSLQSRDVNVLKTKQHASARRIITLLEERKAVYTSLLMASTFFNISIIILSNFLLSPILRFGIVQFIVPIDLDFLIKVILIAFVIVLVARILPKVWATQNYLRFAYSTSAVVEALHLLFRRISVYMVALADGIGQRSGANQSQTASLRELDEAIEINDQGTTTEEKNILKGIVKFGAISVKQVMRFRLEVNGIDYNSSFSDVVKKVEELHYSRLPIYKTSLDEIVGILNTRDLLPHLQETSVDWHTLVRPPYFVPESKPIRDLLKEFQTKRIHFAIVVDEFGGTSGIVTMEDILEEIIGDIRDEFDDEETPVRQIDDHTYVADAKIML